MSMFWMPRIQKVFNVIPALACNGISQPYWEKNFVYPTDNSGKPPATTATTKSTTATGTKTTTTATSTPTSGACTPGSFGLGNGDGYNGACCKDQSDCMDDCISSTCNGPVNPKATTTKTATKTTTTNASTKTTTTKTTTTKATTTKKTTTKKTATATATASCIPGARGKKKGNGKTGYCCSSSSDCVETCRSGTCGI
jgi:hypothetical protein